jgi:DNA-binding transcriptional ArsR family regulator
MTAPPTPDDYPARRLDLIFAALADPTRRALLDRLLAHDGQRTSELAVGFAMSRQAISKHLDVLEEAGLVVSQRKQGETRLFLNRMPLRRFLSMWIEKYTRLQVRVDCF